MKKISFVALTLLLVSTVDAKGWPSLIRKLRLPMEMARLHFKEPDQKLLVPIHSVKVRQIADTWHTPRDGQRLHEGQDIFAPRGTPVYSATEGYIKSIAVNRLGGNTVTVIGAGGREYYYAHLDSYAQGLTEGDHVTTETVLGYVGTTGNAQGAPPHLHFGVYTKDGAINPLPLLVDEPRSLD